MNSYCKSTFTLARVTLTVIVHHKSPSPSDPVFALAFCIRALFMLSSL